MPKMSINPAVEQIAVRLHRDLGFAAPELHYAKILDAVTDAYTFGVASKATEHPDRPCGFTWGNADDGEQICKLTAGHIGPHEASGCYALRGHICLDTTPVFKVGDPCPDGYIARQEWAQVHLDAGQKQMQCGGCGLWMFPHELNPKIFTTMASRTKYGQANIRIETQYCHECFKRHSARKHG
jgi:hypothetical protein